MPVGRGKFDSECELILVANRADAVCVIVLGGARGSGFSMSLDALTAHRSLLGIPSVLRQVADQMEQDRIAAEQQHYHVVKPQQPTEEKKCQQNPEEK